MPERVRASQRVTNKVCSRIMHHLISSLCIAVVNSVLKTPCPKHCCAAYNPLCCVLCLCALQFTPGLTLIARINTAFQCHCTHIPHCLCTFITHVSLIGVKPVRMLLIAHTLCIALLPCTEQTSITNGHTCIAHAGMIPAGNAAAASTAFQGNRATCEYQKNEDDSRNSI